MCRAPGKLHDGTVIPCRKCELCIERRVSDWIGRCIAETKTSSAAHSITLTYGRDENGNSDHFRSAWLTYSDVQKYFKRLRRDGYQFRYLVCGEYGSQKGRCHWHAIMFWEGKVPEHTLSTDKRDMKRFHTDHWPHGHQVWEKVHENSVRYVCKYINKDIGKDERRAHMSMSKKPPIGMRYFSQLAKKYVDAGLAPQDNIYTFPEVKKRDGSRRRFYMADTTLFNFLEDYKTLWHRHKGGKRTLIREVRNADGIVVKQFYAVHCPNSALIEDHDDKIARGMADPDWVPVPRNPPLGPVFGGDGPYLANDPETGKPGIKSTNAKGVWWWRDTKDGYEWQREPGTSEAKDLSSLPRGNRYDQAKRGRGRDLPPSAPWG